MELFFINDILVEYGGISEYKIIAKLRHKTSGYLNWIFNKKRSSQNSGNKFW